MLIRRFRPRVADASDEEVSFILSTYSLCRLNVSCDGVCSIWPRMGGRERTKTALSRTWEPYSHLPFPTRRHRRDQSIQRLVADPFYYVVGHGETPTAIRCSRRARPRFVVARSRRSRVLVRERVRGARLRDGGQLIKSWPRRRPPRDRLPRALAPDPLRVCSLRLLHQLLLGGVAAPGLRDRRPHLPDLWLAASADRADLRPAGRTEDPSTYGPPCRTARARAPALPAADGVRVLTAVLVVTQGRVGSREARAVDRRMESAVDHQARGVAPL